jgi:hypothetical protein
VSPKGNEDLRALLRVIYLQASPDVLKKRLRKKNAPGEARHLCWPDRKDSLSPAVRN